MKQGIKRTVGAVAAVVLLGWVARISYVTVQHARYMEAIKPLNDVNRKILHHRPISDAEWEVVEAGSRSDDAGFRSTAVIFLSNLESSTYRERAHEIMNRLSRDPYEGVRSLSIRVMVQSHDANAKQRLDEELASNPSPWEQNMLSKIKTKYDLIYAGKM